MGILDKAGTVARPGYSRWLIPPAALCVHLSIGQVYSLSVFKTALMSHFEASYVQVGWIFSVAILMLGASSAVFGTWMEHNGPRKAMVASCCCWVGGFVLAALGVQTGQLWLVYVGYGGVGGIGLGIGYISPVSTLMKWFPERPGLATGIAIMGFGGGALFGAPLATALLSAYDPAFDPSVPGTVAGGGAVAATFLTLGGIYLIMMSAGAALIRIPPGFESDETADHLPARNGALVRTRRAVRTPAFYCLWIVLFCNVTAGIGILEEASPMVQDLFRGADGKTAITAGMAAGFVGLLSLANMSGRLGWSTFSDKIGRRWAYVLYLGVGLAMYLVLAGGGSAVVLFMGFMIITFYGGGFATIPAYLKDMFGTLEVGAIHGRLLTAWSAAGICGPLIVNSVLDHAGGEPGTLTAEAYSPAFLVMVGILAVGFTANLLVRGVKREHWDEAQVARYERRLAEDPGLANATWNGGH